MRDTIFDRLEDGRPGARFEMAEQSRSGRRVVLLRVVRSGSPPGADSVRGLLQALE